MTKTGKYFLILLVHFFFKTITFGQLNSIDSIQLELKNAKHDTTRAEIIVMLAEEFSYSNPDTLIPISLQAIALIDKNLPKANKQERHAFLTIKAYALSNISAMYHRRGNISKTLNYLERSLKIDTELGNKKAIAGSLQNIGIIYLKQGDSRNALEYSNRSLKMLEEIGDKFGIANSIMSIGLIYDGQGDIPKALNYYSRGLKIQEEIKDKEGIASSLINIGRIYNKQGDYLKALDYFNQSLKLAEEIGYQIGISTSLANIGLVYDGRYELIKALDYYKRSLKIQEGAGDVAGMAASLNNIGMIYYKQHQYDKALEYYYRSKAIVKEIGYKGAFATLLNNISGIYMKQKKYSLAYSFSDSSLMLSKQIGIPESIRSAEALLSRIDSALGNYAGAFEHYKQYIIYRDSINNVGTRKASIKNQLKYEFEKKEAVMMEHQDKERAVSAEKNRRQQIVIWSVALGLLLVIGFAGFVFRSLKITREQKVIIEEKQKDILDSIHYAKRIQQSLLPRENFINRTLGRLMKI